MVVELACFLLVATKGKDPSILPSWALDEEGKDICVFVGRLPFGRPLRDDACQSPIPLMTVVSHLACTTRRISCLTGVGHRAFCYPVLSQIQTMWFCFDPVERQYVYHSQFQQYHLETPFDKQFRSLCSEC